MKHFCQVLTLDFGICTLVASFNLENTLEICRAFFKIACFNKIIEIPTKRAGL